MDNQRSHRTPRDALEPQGPAEIMICEARMPEARGIDDVRIFLHVNILRKKHNWNKIDILAAKGHHMQATKNMRALRIMKPRLETYLSRVSEKPCSLQFAQALRIKRNQPMAKWSTSSTFQLVTVWEKNHRCP